MILRKLMILFCCAFFMQANAQFSKGDRMVGANVGSVFYNSNKTVYTYPAPTIGVTYNTSNFGVNISPTYGWFINERVVVGPSIIISYNHSKTFYTDDGNGNTFFEEKINRLNLGLGAFARNYFATQGKFYPYAQVGFNFGIGSSKTEGFEFSNVNDKTTSSGKGSGNFFANAGLSFGITKMLSKYTGLEVSIGYNYAYEKMDFKETSLFDAGNNGSIDQTSVSDLTQKFTNHGVVLGVGFQVFLDKRKRK